MNGQVERQYGNQAIHYISGPKKEEEDLRATIYYVHKGLKEVICYLQMDS